VVLVLWVGGIDVAQQLNLIKALVKVVLQAKQSHRKVTLKQTIKAVSSSIG
jgi:hypothetical protein